MSHQTSWKGTALEKNSLSQALVDQSVFFMGSPIPIVVIDLAGRVQILNPAAEQFLGCTLLDVKDRAYPFVKPEELEAQALLLKRVAAGEVIPKHIAVRIDADGNPLQVEVTLNTITIGTDVAGIVEFLNPVATDSQLMMLMGAVEALPHGTIICDATLPDRPIIYANPAFVSLTGYTREEILGWNCRFLQGPQTDQATITALRQAIAEYRQFEGELLNYRKDGTPFWNRLTITPVTNHRGAPAYFVGVQTDVTDRKRVELQLQQKEQLFEHGPAVIFRWETTWPYRTISVSANVKQFGYDPIDLVNGVIEWTHIIHPDDRERVHLEIQMFQQQRPLPTFAEQYYRIVCADRSVRWVYDYTVPVLDKNGALVFADGYLLDITRRKQAEDALRESESRLRRVGDNLPNGALYQIVISPEGKRKYTYISAGAERMLGYSVEALMADADLAYNSVLEADVPALLAAESKAWDELSIFNHTVRICTTTGELKWIHCQSAPQRNPDGSTVWDGVVIDITQSRYAEESLKRSERFLNAVFENSPVAMEVFSPDGYLLRINTSMSRFLGYSDGGASSIGKYNILTDPVAQSLNSPAWFKRALQGETVEAHSQTVDLEKLGQWAITPRIVYYDVAFVPIADDSGVVTNVVVMIWDTTAQKEAERSLRQKEQLLRQAAKIAKVGGWAIDVKSQKLFWSEETYRIHEVTSGYEPDLEAAIDFYAPEARPVIQDAVKRGMRDAESFDLELSFVTAQGKSLWVRALGEPEFENGTCVRLAGAFQDITEQKLTELALRESEERFRSIVNTLPQMVCLIDRNLHYQFVNRAYCEFFQLDQSQIIGKTVPEIIGSQAFAQNRLLIEQALGGETVHFCHQMSFPHAVAYFDGNLVPHRSAQGDIIGYFAVVTNVTRFKEAEEQLRMSEERLALALQGGDLGLWDVDVAHHRVYTNEWWKRVLGDYPEGTSYYRMEDWEKALHPDDQHSTFQKFFDHLNGITPIYEAEYRIQTSSGKWIWVFAKGMVTRWDAEGKAVRVVGTSLDISERKNLEEQLRQAQKMEAIGRMAGGIAHDFNNVLTIIIGYINILQQRLGPGHNCYPISEQLLKASERGAALAQQLLTFSRKQKVKLKPINLNDSVSTIEQFLRRLVGDDLELILLMDEELGMIRADVGQIEQVIMNLAVNARDAMPNGGKLIIETSNIELDEEFTQFHPELHPGKYILLGVTDTGIGMDEQVKACIFEPFFTTKDAGRGTGLGLAIVYGIVQTCGGHIVVDSMPGAGTSFSIYFPRIQTGLPGERSNSPDQIVRKPKKLILLVEDEAEIRALLARLLEEQGYAVLTAENGFEALQVATEYGEPIQLLVTDVRMPKMDGLELVRVLSPHHPDMKILYMSGYVDTVLRKNEAFMQSCFLEKPFPPDPFIDRVQELLGDRVTE